MSQTIIPKSDQLNAEDMLSGPRTVTITEVRRGSAEQPVDIVLAEFGPGRPFKPCKTMRRVLVAAWGPDAAAYVGRRMTIYRDPAVKFGGMDVGGIRISHLSHIDKRITVALTVTRGKRAPNVVEPLPEPEPMITPALSKRLYGLLKQAGHGEASAALLYLSGQLGRDVPSTKDLTVAEAMRCIGALEAPPAEEQQQTGFDDEQWLAGGNEGGEPQ